MSEGGEPRRRRRAPSSPPPPPAGSATRGIILVVAAVVLGVVLLRDNDAVTVQGNVGAESPSDDGDGDTDTTSTSSTTSTTLRAEALVKVKVLNGSGVTGAAATITDQLKALGYLTASPGNSDGRVAATEVYFVAGYEGEAARLAAELGAATTSVAPMPTPAPVPDLESSNILVVVGPDIAPAA